MPHTVSLPYWYWMPGCMKLRPDLASLTDAILVKKLPRLKPKCSSTRKLSRMAPPISITALTICTQVVATMPPAIT